MKLKILISMDMALNSL